MCRHPFVLLATILPTRPVVVSAIFALMPADVSLRVTFSLSPWFIRNVSGVGMKLSAVIVSGPGGPPGCPLIVRKAKFAGSTQLGLKAAFGGLPGPWSAPNSPWRLKIATAAHQWMRSHETFWMNGGYPGG